MKAIIHIGTPKSGTTTIQSFLALNRLALRDQGIRYEPYDPRNVAQLELGLTGVVRAGQTVTAPNKLHALGVTASADSQRAYVDRFEAMLHDNVAKWPEHTYLASSEQIHSWLSSPPRIRALHETLLRHFDEVRYVVYYRPQEEFMLSTYSERIRRGEILTFDEHFNQRLEKMDFGRKAAMWARIVGQENLTVRLLDRGVMLNGDLLDDFCATVGIDRTPLQEPPRMNVSLTAEEMRLYLKLGKRIPARLKSGAPSPVFFGLLGLMRRFLPKPGTRLSLTEAQRIRIRAVNVDGNEILRATWFPERETLFTPK
jgi:hypothetical protein